MVHSKGAERLWISPTAIIASIFSICAPFALGSLHNLSGLIYLCYFVMGLYPVTGMIRIRRYDGSPMIMKI